MEREGRSGEVGFVTESPGTQNEMTVKKGMKVNGGEGVAIDEKDVGGEVKVMAADRVRWRFIISALYSLRNKRT